MTQFFRELRSELRKVAWPSRRASLHNAAIVSVVLLAFVVVLVALDLGFGWSTARLFASWTIAVAGLYTIALVIIPAKVIAAASERSGWRRAEYAASPLVNDLSLRRRPPDTTM